MSFHNIQEHALVLTVPWEGRTYIIPLQGPCVLPVAEPYLELLGRSKRENNRSLLPSVFSSAVRNGDVSFGP